MSHPQSSYKLTYTAQSFKAALNSLGTHLPAHPDNIQALQLLPVFVVVAVVDNETLAGHPHIHLDTLMHTWAEENHWIIRTILEQSESIHFTAAKESSPISDVSVFRYLLVPAQKTQITPEKKDAAAHIIDDQITAYLRRKLKPVPTYNYAVDSSGQVADFVLGANKTRQYIDCHILSVSQMLRRHKLICFDMDSTLIKQEVITELAKIAGVGDEVNNITESAMRGEIDFSTSFAQRMQLLAGLDASVIDTIKPMLIPQAGAFATIAAFKALGYHTALISGGFIPFAEHVAKLLGIDEYHANELEIDGGKLSGQVLYPIIDGKQKAKIVAKIADERSISLDEVVCVGDGANDLPMMAISDMGVAFHAKPIVQVKADAAINITGLEGVLYALGYPALQSSATPTTNL